MNRSTSGSALLTAIFILAFAGISLALLQRRAFRLGQLRHEERLGIESEQHRWRDLSKSFELPPSTKSSCETRVCIWRNTFDSTSPLPAELSPLTGYPWKALPLWSGAFLADSPERCLGLLRPPADLTPGALLSRRSCGTIPASGSADGNLFIPGAAELNLPALTVRGAIEISSLTARLRTTVFAGGDIIIGELSAAEPILLISATGDIVVKIASATGTVSAISPRSVYLPPGAAAPALDGELPGQLRFIVLGAVRD